MHNMMHIAYASYCACAQYACAHAHIVHVQYAYDAYCICILLHIPTMYAPMEKSCD